MKSPKREHAKRMLIHYIELASGDLSDPSEIGDIVDLIADAVLEELAQLRKEENEAR